MYTMLWKRAISRAQFSPLNFLRPSLPSRVIPSWSLQPSHPLYLPFYLSSHPSLPPRPILLSTPLSRFLCQDAKRNTPSHNFHIITVNFASSNRIIRITANTKRSQSCNNWNNCPQLWTNWRIFLVQLSHPFDSQFLLTAHWKPIINELCTSLGQKIFAPIQSSLS